MWSFLRPYLSHNIDHPIGAILFLRIQRDKRKKPRHPTVCKWRTLSEEPTLIRSIAKIRTILFVGASSLKEYPYHPFRTFSELFDTIRDVRRTLAHDSGARPASSTASSTALRSCECSLFLAIDRTNFIHFNNLITNTNWLECDSSTGSNATRKCC
jgi:hypothetical protein